MLRPIVLSLVSFLLVACGSSDNNGSSNSTQAVTCESNSNVALVGCWTSEACTQNITDSSLYHQGLLIFHNNGTFNEGLNFYQNASCSGTPYVTDIAPADTYNIGPSVLSSEGLTSYPLTMMDSGFTFYSAFHITADSRLCFNVGDYLVNGNTSILQAIHFTPLAGISIDTNSGACLTK